MQRKNEQTFYSDNAKSEKLRPMHSLGTYGYDMEKIGVDYDGAPFIPVTKE